jgi:hypothetical protein
VDDEVARAWSGKSGRMVTYLLGAVAVVYFASIWAEAAIRQAVSTRWLPGPLAYFAQLASLFPSPTHHAIDYRVEGFRCRDRTWSEIDVSPWFPIDADNKEGRFYRAIHFYGDQHPHRQTLRALDEFIVSHYDADLIDAASRGQSGEPIGGVRFVRLRVPVGSPGDGATRYGRTPLASHPADERKDLYYTPESKREERCKLLGQ